jgi:hypothetical protein
MCARGSYDILAAYLTALDPGLACAIFEESRDEDGLTDM